MEKLPIPEAPPVKKQKTIVTFDAEPEHADSDHTDSKTAISKASSRPLPWWYIRQADIIKLVDAQEQKDDPLFLYSLKQIETNIESIKSLKAISRVFFAIKANFNSTIIKTAAAKGLGFETVSIQELRYVREIVGEVAKQNDRFLFTPNFAPRSEYVQAFELGAFVTLDNVWPLKNWPDVFKNQKVFLRIDPGEGSGHHAHVRTGGTRSKFGITVEELSSPATKETIKSLNLTVIGLHIHKGSGIDDPTAWAKNAKFLVNLLPDFPSIKYLNLGGGLPIPYQPNDPALDLVQLNKSLSAFKDQLNSSGMAVELWLEPGRILVAQSCALISRVTQLKWKPGKSFVGVNTGMNTLIRPCLYSSYHHIVNLSRLKSKVVDENAAYNDETFVVDVVGNICETGDVLGHDRLLPNTTTEGDIILIDAAGAYGRSMSSSYNLRPPPAELFLPE